VFNGLSLNVRNGRLAKTSYVNASAKKVNKNENTTYVNITRTKSVPSNGYIVIDHVFSVGSGGKSPQLTSVWFYK